MKESNNPIGIFDSGIGGLTVAYAVNQLLPNENIIYFGDTAHFPYGDKSTAAIQSYAVKISEMLLNQHCKVILIACNSASAAAYKLVKEYVGSRAKVINVIDPIVQYVGAEYPNGKVGLIGTKKTVSSNVYQRKIDKLNKDIIFKAFATPLLAPMIEEGYFNNAISGSIISNYLKDPSLDGIESLILGCTHYPLIKEEIKNHYRGEVNVIDSSDIVAVAVKEYLSSSHLLNEEKTPKHKFYVSDYTQSFAESTRLFFRQEVHLERYPLWE
ncbi:glutamate racemase [uncultured Cytophaga sp.]|uniref:glutamate racemase n=1 Tax=uncultured Cytophaga sp. TaxID=160238 RepID=UPI0026227A94|nr:glutamate racemase [uncultured Cytophaga sp.]